MGETSFDHFTLSSDYSLDTSKYNLSQIHDHLYNIHSEPEYKQHDGISHIQLTNLNNHSKDSTSSKFSVPDLSHSNEDNENVLTRDSNSLVQELETEISNLRNENSRLRDTNAAWMDFRDKVLKLGKKDHFEKRIIEGLDPQNDSSNFDKNYLLNDTAEYKSLLERVQFLESELDKATGAEKKIGEELMKSQELSTNLKIKLEQNLIRCELLQVSYTRMKECYDNLLSQHQLLTEKLQSFYEDESTAQNVASSLKNDLELTQRQLNEVIKSLNDSKEELEFWVSECQKYKRDYLYYRMSADNNAKRIDQFLILLRDKDADFKALEEEHVRLLKKMVLK